MARYNENIKPKGVFIMNRTITLATYPFYIPISEEVIKKAIIKKIEELSIKTNMPGDKLPVYFYSSPPKEHTNTIAYFTYKDKGTYIKPISFSFNLFKFREIKNISSSQISDIVAHEFAHYVRDMWYGPVDGDGHDKKFREVCRKLGCNSPEPVHREHLTKIFK